MCVRVWGFWGGGGALPILGVRNCPAEGVFRRESEADLLVYCLSAGDPTSGAGVEACSVRTGVHFIEVILVSLDTEEQLSDWTLDVGDM